MVIEKYITRINFVEICSGGEHNHVRRYEGCMASQEFLYDGIHSAGVAVLEDGKLRTIIEVSGSHATATWEEARKSRRYRVGIQNVWEVDATRVINTQSKLQSEEGTDVDLSAVTGTKCQPCARAFKLKHDAHVQQLAELRKEIAASERRIVAKRKASALNAQSPRATINK